MSGGAYVVARLDDRIGDRRLDLAFELLPGTTTRLAGPSGAGKTTVLRWLAGLIRLEGELIVDGEVWSDARTHRPPHLRCVGMAFQGGSLLPHLTVAENLAYAAARAEAPLGVADLTERLAIAELLPRRPGTLSGGEMQRASLARALVGAPRLLLLDEPFSALDGQARGDLWKRLSDVRADLGPTILLVSHDESNVAVSVMSLPVEESCSQVDPVLFSLHDR